jgi:phenylpropionate dioxygenase-like ring-hydroxylating dioxygenase large terminal subunit
LDTGTIKHLIASHKSGYALEQAFYQDPDIYARDIERIYMKAWLYAGHESEIPKVGNYFLFNFDKESVIIVRSAAAEISALVNVCRHRGSRVCLATSGKASRLTCQYHGWTYALNGELLGAAQMPESFDKTRKALKRIHLRCLQGMIFVNFADQPASFDPIEDDLVDCLRPYRLDRAKVAHRQSYPIAANWKLAVENYSECYHCAVAHPEYSRGHGLAVPEEQYARELTEVMARAASCGLSEKAVAKIHLCSGEIGTDRSYERYPLLRGHLTGSEDGKPVAPLLGDIKDYDGGATDFQVGPVTYALAYCDHVVVYRFTPLSVDSTDCDITWLVNESAEEGKDYELKKLTWMWDVTTTADQHIIERNQEGVNSRFYEAGPYSKMETVTQAFVDWYVKTIAA